MVLSVSTYLLSNVSFDLGNASKTIGISIDPLIPSFGGRGGGTDSQQLLLKGKFYPSGTVKATMKNCRLETRG